MLAHVRAFISMKLGFITHEVIVLVLVMHSYFQHMFFVITHWNLCKNYKVNPSLYFYHSILLHWVNIQLLKGIQVFPAEWASPITTPFKNRKCLHSASVPPAPTAQDNQF